MKKNNELSLIPVILFEKTEDKIFQALEMIFAVKKPNGYEIIQGYCTGMNLPSIFEVEKFSFEFCCLECSMEWLMSLFDFFDIDEARLKINNYLEDYECKVGIVNGNIYTIMPCKNESNLLKEKLEHFVDTETINTHDLIRQLYFKSKENIRKRG